MSVEQLARPSEGAAPPLPLAKECLYASCYCEENVFKLVKQLQEAGQEHLSCSWAVFISNPSRSVPLWSQKAGRGEEHLVVWDYHVILVYCTGTASLVYDLDSTLAFPSPLPQYCSATLRSDSLLEEPYHRRLRAVPGRQFLATFSSDRSHMVRPLARHQPSPPPRLRTASGWRLPPAGRVCRLEEGGQLTWTASLTWGRGAWGRFTLWRPSHRGSLGSTPQELVVTCDDIWWEKYTLTWDNKRVEGIPR